MTILLFTLGAFVLSFVLTLSFIRWRDYRNHRHDWDMSLTDLLADMKRPDHTVDFNWDWPEPYNIDTIEGKVVKPNDN